MFKILSNELRTGTGALINEDSFEHSLEHYNAMVFMLDFTLGTTSNPDALDVRVQTLVEGTTDANSTWIDIVRFAAHAGDDSALQSYQKVVGHLAQAGFLSSATLGANAVRHLPLGKYRVRWSGAAGSWTFGVFAMGIIKDTSRAY